MEFRCKVKRSKLRWFRHIQRMGERRYPKDRHYLGKGTEDTQGAGVKLEWWLIWKIEVWTGNYCCGWKAGVIGKYGGGYLTPRHRKLESRADDDDDIIITITNHKIAVATHSATCDDLNIMNYIINKKWSYYDTIIINLGTKINIHSCSKTKMVPN